MSPTSATYLLDPEQARPVEFNYQNCIYHVCPNCARAYELRTCHGELIVTFELCEKHVDAHNDRRFDQDLLDQIRQDIHLVYPPEICAITTPPEWIPTLLHGDYTRVTRDVKLETAEPVIIFAHADGCSRSENPDIVIISLTAISHLDDIARTHLANIKDILDSDNPTARLALKAEHTRLENCLAASNTAKGMYIKCCTGEYRNALDDELIPDSTAPNGYRSSDFGYAVLDLEGPCERKRWTFNEDGWPNPIPTTFTYLKLKKQLEHVTNGQETEDDLLQTAWYMTRSGKRSEGFLRKYPDGKYTSRG
ncbi:uncharacterized protein A1O9_00266 [Exophiala aquamarina CBS 119918]|uniref:Uncharacterized protein n=1 Tax=Exophiala aquamarina CBS 119918 TaxID=1182545 RepID=A0A072PQE5_9EURO|nr:uncharacterized protein A1O9_00266 [Exophiala aquamarina CBS 119918]KEF62294.1 hypothetical protein A1O9_00266 [Exophiala aquamarina CBS 119918]